MEYEDIERELSFDEMDQMDEYQPCVEDMFDEDDPMTYPEMFED